MTPLSLGIKIAGNGMDIVINRNAQIPFDVTKKYQTHKQNQDRVSIDVRQGESSVATENYSLGRFTMANIPPGPAGAHKVEVNFKIDANCILTVRSKTLHDGVNHDMVIKPTDHFALTDDDVNRMIAEGQFMRDQISMGEPDDDQEFVAPAGQQ